MASNKIICTIPWVASRNLQDPVLALLQNFTESFAVCGQSQSSRGRCQPFEPNEESQKKGAENVRRTSAIKASFLQALPQAENRFSGAAQPSTDMVHVALVGGRRASPYNVWIHWLPRTVQHADVVWNKSNDFFNSGGSLP